MTDHRPRIHIWPVEKGFAWQGRIGHPGATPHTESTAGAAFEAALASIDYADAVVMFGSIPNSPRR